MSAVENKPHKKEIQRFNEMINYMKMFIPNLSKRMGPQIQLSEEEKNLIEVEP